MARTVVPLNDTKIKKAKSEGSNVKLSDGGGLYLLIDKKNNKFWRFDYYRPYSKKRNTISFGSYPEVSLADARSRRDEARSLLAQNIDPREEKLRINNEITNSLENTFKKIAEEWKTKQNFAESTIQKSNSLLEVIYENIGNKPIDKITPVDVLNVCRIYERQGKLETAKKVKVRCGQVFRYGVATGRCERDVTQDLRGAIKTPVVRHMPAITDIKEFARLLDAIDQYDGTIITKIAFKIAPLVFVRPGELRKAKWADIDLDGAIWAYTPPKTRIKTGVELIVPLATQVVTLLKEIHPITSNCSEYVFPAVTSSKRPMSDNTINQAFRRLGYEREAVSAHGFRASARTILEEQLEFPVEIIEMQLGHQVRDMHGRAYNRTKHLEKRKIMMQAWADYCDKIKSEYIESLS
ncbi:MULTISPECIES: tyrosine-type recombinase/integrase [unclassified Acinetobacter]|uniref:tyrosine-type recombinase/integrase n=1 Tax=unclassified Acinetobacter TaxID=196816 RepID=UPI0029343B7F|nr:MULTISPECIES: integrase arm-type DNA-binding domain-containing protein [unclassified Acinetobacter]WOE32729.1 tyrosine-type recombinase/integrase [Acinetobacter sp. SAAs470]WOE38205.1 tyrosine-type recombinase/integrase [Acinetobacter sp. SAAs474]